MYGIKIIILYIVVINYIIEAHTVLGNNVIFNPDKVYKEYIINTDHYTSPDLEINDVVLDGRFKRDVKVHKKSGSDVYSIIAREKVIDDDQQVLTASGQLSNLKPGKNSYTATADLEYRQKNGHSLSLSAQHNTDSSNKLSAEGNVRLFKDNKNTIDAKAFVEKEFTRFKDFTTYGGKLDLINKNGNSASVSAHHDSTFGNQISADAQLKLMHTGKHDLNAEAFWSRYIPNKLDVPSYDAYGGGLDYKHKNGHGASLSVQHIPKIGDEISAKGILNLYNSKNHNLDISSGLTRHFSLNPSIPNYNTYSGNIDYNFKDKFGGNLGIKHSALDDKTDFSAMGKYNIFKDKDSSFDFSAGLSKSISPRFSDPWKPTFMFGFKKEFK